MCLTDEVLDDVELTITTGKVKWSTAIIVLTRWVTVCLTDEVLDEVELTIATGEVKWSTAIIILT